LHGKLDYESVSWLLDYHRVMEKEGGEYGRGENENKADEGGVCITWSSVRRR
jgi:hypothetical protein